MWFEYEQIPHQRLHGYGRAEASLVGIWWSDWLGGNDSLLNAVVDNTTTQQPPDCVAALSLSHSLTV